MSAVIGEHGALQPVHEDLAIVVMGVSGSGKTTVGMLIAAWLGWDFEEGDLLHPAANVRKMHAGQPLTDADRWPWLCRIGAWIEGEGRAGKSGVVTCSALKRAYRDLLRDGRPHVRFACLAGASDVVGSRLAVRTGHFMPGTLLASQYAALEPLQPDEPGVTVDVTGTPERIAQNVIDALHLTARGEARRTLGK